MVRGFFSPRKPESKSASGQSLPAARRLAGYEVRIGPKADLIPMPESSADAPHPRNRAEEYDDADPDKRDRLVPQPSALE